MSLLGQGGPSCSTHGDDRFRIVLHGRPDTEPSPDGVGNERDSARSADKIDAGNVLGAGVGVGQDLFERIDRGVNVGSNELFQLCPRELNVAFQPRHPQLANADLAQRLLGPLHLGA